MKIDSSKIIIYLIIFLIILSVGYYALNNRWKGLSMEDAYEQRDISVDELRELSIEKTYEVYAHNTLYLLHNINKSLINIQPVIDGNIVNKENSDFIISQFNLIKLYGTDGIIDFPKPIDKDTRQIYDFINQDLYLILKEVDIRVKKEIQTNKRSYKELIKYTSYMKNSILNNRILDINLNGNIIKTKNTNLKVSDKEIIAIITEEIDKIKEAVNKNKF